MHLRLSQGQEVGDAGLEFGGIEGLLQEVGGTGLDRLDADCLVGVRGHHDDGNQAISRPGAQRRSKLDTIHFGHYVIDDHQIVLMLATKRDCLERIETELDFTGNHFADYRSDERKAGPTIVNNKQAHVPPPRPLEG